MIENDIKIFRIASFYVYDLHFTFCIVLVELRTYRCNETWEFNVYFSSCWKRESADTNTVCYHRHMNI